MFDVFLWRGKSLKSCLGSSVETQQLSVLVQVSASCITSFLRDPEGVNRVLKNAVQRVECLGKCQPWLQTQTWQLHLQIKSTCALWDEILI